ncbi:aminotransferase class IV [Brevundimonas aurifodinae]|uniref:Probable branched-chain-amino-acid aminotransferase n=1 Tax=Brevundimonas aurifodinae TaxID=1508312 RepID=A0ABV1NPK6_9CAUL
MILIDGLPATEDDLRYQALVNYGAYTSFRVEAGGVRGLDRHLARLVANAEELFGAAVETGRLRDFIRTALDDRRDAWLRISVFSPEIWARLPSGRVRPKVMTTVSPPPPPLADSVRVQVQTYGRDAAHIKHTATFPLIRARRLALDAGFDDALFADADGLVSEGSLWNVGFLKGDTVVWPQADMLPGVAQALIQAGLDGVGLDQRAQPVRVGDLDGFDGAFLCNSATPACPITAIGAVAFDADPDRIQKIVQAWASAPLQPI